MNQHTAAKFASLALLITIGLTAVGSAQDTDTVTGTVTADVTETVVIKIDTLDASSNAFGSITEADIQAGTKVLSGAFDIDVYAITDYTVDVEITSITSSGSATPPGAPSLLLAASASGSAGTTPVPDTAFSGLNTPISLDGAFSNVNNADGTGEGSTIDLTLDMDELGDREQGETLTYELDFIVTEQ